MMDIGNKLIINSDEIISLLDINTVKNNKSFNNLLQKCKEDDNYYNENLEKNKIKSYIVTKLGNQTYIYASSFTTKALKERVIV